MNRTITLALLVFFQSSLCANDQITPVRILGTNASAYLANSIKFLDSSRILAQGSYSAALIDVDSGEVNELKKPGELKHFIGKGVVGGNRWLASLTPNPFPQRTREVVKTNFTIWDLNEAKEKTNIACDGRISVFAISHHGKTLIVANQHSLDFYSVKTGERIKSVRDETTRTTHLSFSEDGKSLLRCFTENGKELPQYRLHQFSSSDLLADVIHSNQLDSRVRGVTATQAKDTFVFQFANGMAVVRNCSNNSGFKTEPETRQVRSIAVDPSGTRIVTCGIDQKIRYWKRTGQEPARLVRVDESSGTRAIAFSNDGRNVAMRLSGKIRIYDFESGLEVNQRKGIATGALAAVAISPDESQVVAADYLGRLQVWDLNSGEMTLLNDNDFTGVRYDPWVGPQFSQFSPDGQTILSGSNSSHNAVNLWDANTGKRKGFYPDYRQPIMGVAWSVDGKMFASCTRNQKMRVMSSDGTLIATIEKASMTPVFFPDGKRILAADNYGHSAGLRVFEIQTGKTLKILSSAGRGGRVGGVAMTTDGNYVATTFQTDRVQAWDTRNGTVVFDVKLTELREGGIFGSVSFSPDGKLLAVSLGSRNVLLLDATTGETLLKFPAHDAQVTAVVFSKKYLVTASSDLTVKLWDRDRLTALAYQ